MTIPIFVGIISILQQFRPYFRKHISDKLDHHEYMFLNSFVISILASIYLVYLFAIEHTTIDKVIQKYKTLTFYEILFIIGLSSLTIISGFLMFEMDKNHNTPFLNSIFVKSAGILGLIAMSIFLFKESYKAHQFVGVAFILFGIYLASTKKLELLNLFPKFFIK